MIFQLIQEQEYSKLLEDNMHHVQAITELSKEDYSRSEDYRNLLSIGRQTQNILIVGRNTNLLTLFLLLSNNKSDLYCFDINQNCYEYFNQHFPNSIECLSSDDHDLHKTDIDHYRDVLDNLCNFKDENSDLKMDLVLINRCSQDHISNSRLSNLLFFNAREMTVSDSILIWGGDTQLFNGYTRDKMIEPFSLENGTLQLSKFVWIKRSIAVCTLALGEKYKELVKYGILSRQLYCEKYGYDLHEDESVYDESRPMAWSKINLIRKYLSQYEYVVWIDADSYIMNDNIKLDSIITNYMGELDMMVAQDWKMINTGVIFIKNTEWSRKFLDLIYDQIQFLHHPNWEQTAFIHLLKHNISNSSEHIKVLPLSQQNVINAYWYSYVYNVFILHFPGCWRDDKENGLSTAMQRYCPIRREGETDQEYETRMCWIKTEAEKVRP